MEEKKEIKNEKLVAVSGGYETGFTDDGKPYCPVCGKVGIRLITSGPSEDTYQCDMCGQFSTFAKSAPAAAAITACPVCGCSGEGFRLIRREGNTEIRKCVMCGHETQCPVI